MLKNFYLQKNIIQSPRHFVGQVRDGFLHVFIKIDWESRNKPEDVSLAGMKRWCSWTQDIQEKFFCNEFTIEEVSAWIPRGLILRLLCKTLMVFLQYFKTCINP